MKSLILIITLFFISCSQQGDSARSTKSLIALRGEPNLIETSQIDSSKEFFEYDDSKYQVDTNSQTIDSKFRKPQGEEISINYWKDRFQDTYYELSKNSGNTDETVMNVPSEKLSVTYTQRGVVKWVVSRDNL